MSRERERIDELSEAISDSQEIDWDAEQRAMKDSDEAPVVRQLAVIARLADAYRHMSEPAERLPFSTWGHLRLVARIGSGSYGDVFRAWDETLQQEVALKLYHPSVQHDPLTRNTLLEEARNLAKVRHENVVRVLGADVHRGCVGFWMEFLVGETLEQMLASRGKLKAEEAVEIGVKVCRGLATVHAAGVIHRDIKPANVFREFDGRVCLLDFGAGTALQHTTQRIGTPVYMAPETLLRATSSKQSDIYSLGVMLFHMVSNRLPVEAADHAELLRKHELRDRLSLTDLEPETPSRFRRVVDRCLESDPTNRFANADEVARALDDVVVLQPRRTRYVVGVFTVLLLAVAVARFLPSWSRRHSGSTKEVPRIAVIGFQGRAGSSDSTSAVALADLVHTGLLEITPWRVVSPEFIEDLKHRRLSTGSRRISEAEALAVAREAEASLLLTGTLASGQSSHSLGWRLVATKTGESVAGKQSEAGELAELADIIVNEVLHAALDGDSKSLEETPRRVAELTTASPKAYRHYVAGQSEDEAGRRQNARREFQAAVTLDSTFALAWFALAENHIFDSEQETKRSLMNRAWDLRAHLGVKDLLRVEAQMELLNGLDAESRQTCLRILERWPDDRETLRWVAGSYIGSWNFNEALRVLERGLRFYPNDEDMLESHRFAMTWGGKARDALPSCNAFVRANRTDPKAWRELGRAFLLAGLPDSAQSCAEAARRLDPNAFANETLLGLCAFGRGDLKESIRIFESAVNRTDVPPVSRAWAILGIQIGLRYLYLEAGRYEAALAAFNRAESMAGIQGPQTRRRIENFRVWSLLSVGRPREAYELWQSWRGRNDLNPHDQWEVEWWHAAALAGLDSLQAARSSILRLRSELTPSWPTVWDLRTEMLSAEIEIAAGNPKVALEALEQSRRIGDPVTSEFYVWQQLIEARACLLAGDLDRGAAACEKLLGIYRGCARAQFYLAQIEEQRGRARQAIAAYEACLGLWSEADRGHRERAIAAERLASLQSNPPRR